MNDDVCLYVDSQDRALAAAQYLMEQRITFHVAPCVNDRFEVSCAELYMRQLHTACGYLSQEQMEERLILLLRATYAAAKEYFFIMDRAADLGPERADMLDEIGRKLTDTVGNVEQMAVMTNPKRFTPAVLKIIRDGDGT